MDPTLIFLAAALLAADTSLTQQAISLLGTDPISTHSLESVWNGKQTAFVDYPIQADEAGDLGLKLEAVQRSDGRLQRFVITEVGPDGGDPLISAIGFANADRDSAKELIVVLEWPQKHYDYEGSFYEVRLFDNPKAGQPFLSPLKLSNHFGLGCECWYRDGRKREHFRFATIASVKSELRRLGY